MVNERSLQDLPPAATKPGAVAILDAALSAFESVGYEGASMRDVAKGAGLSVSSIYHHYGNKQELFFGIVQRVTQDLHQMAQGAFERGSGESASRRIEIITEDFIRFYVDRSLECRILDKERRHLEAENADWQIERRRQVQSYVDQVIAAGIADGEFDPLFPDQVGRSLMVVLRDVCNWYRPGHRMSPDELAAGYSRQALAMLGVPR